jgi:hypothetical protein
LGAKLTAIQVGAKVRILEPSYVSGKTGVVISPETLSDGKTSRRWIIQVEAEEIMLSLDPEQFLVLS